MFIETGTPIEPGSYIGSTEFEDIQARAPFIGRLTACQKLLKELDGLPNPSERQRKDLASEITSLELILDPDSELPVGGTAYESSFDDPEVESESEPSLKDKVRSALDILKVAVKGAQQLPEDEAFELLGTINDGCDDTYSSITEVTLQIEAARDSGAANDDPSPDQTSPTTEEPAPNIDHVVPPKQQTYTIKPPEYKTYTEGADPDMLLKQPAEFINRLVGLIEASDRPVKVSKIVQELFSVGFLPEAQFTVLRQLLREARQSKTVKYIDNKGFWLPGRPLRPRQEPNQAELTDAIHAAGIFDRLGITKPKHRGRC